MFMSVGDGHLYTRLFIRRCTVLKVDAIVALSVLGFVLIHILFVIRKATCGVHCRIRGKLTRIEENIVGLVYHLVLLSFLQGQN